MPTEILMPALSPTMEEGTLAKWLVKEGDTVKSGDIIAEIETDKATMEFEAVDEGVVGKILIAEGAQGVKVNTPIAVLLEEGESAADIGSAPKAAAPAAAAPAAAAAPDAASAPAPAPAPAAAPAAGGAGTPVTAPMPGKVLRVAVSVGAPVKNGDIVLILEAMKMENEIFSPVDGVVKEIRARDGDTVNTGDVMVIIG